MHPLLVSAPNTGGGIAMIENGQVTTLASDGTAGMFSAGKRLAIARQDKTVYLSQDNQPLVSIRLNRKADVHDVRMQGDNLYVVVTGPNRIVEINMRDLAMTNHWTFGKAYDSWHINCLGDINGRLCFSAFGKFTTYRGYKGTSDGTGFVADLRTGETIINGLSHPHSIVAEGDTVWICNSYPQEVLKISGGARQSSGNLGGYTRGLCIAGNSLFVGVSRLRNAAADDYSSAFVAELDKHSLKPISKIHVPFGEIYDITPLASEHMKEAVMSLIQRSGYQKGLRKLQNFLAATRISAAP